MTSASPSALPAQERTALFAALRPNLAFIDKRDSGFQLAAYLGRPFTSHFAGLVELGVTKAGERRVVYSGFSYFRVDSLPGEIGISLATGFQI